MSEPDLPEGRPDQIEVTVAWQDDEGGLRGVVNVRNVSVATVRISGKPTLVPLTPHLEPVGVSTVVTAELRLPGYAVLEPGRRARAEIRWNAWTGPAPGDQILVRWPGGAAQGTADGPTAPMRRDGPTNISSSWFRLLPEDAA